MAFSKHFSCFPKELKAKLSHGTGNFEYYLESIDLRAAAVGNSFLPTNGEGFWTAKSLTLGEPMGSEGCVMHLPNAVVLMTSVMSKVQQRCASLSVSELNLCWTCGYLWCCQKNIECYSPQSWWILSYREELFVLGTLLSFMRSK